MAYPTITDWCDNCEGIEPSDPEFKVLVVQALCQIISGSGGGGGAPILLLCDDNGGVLTPFVRRYNTDGTVTNEDLNGDPYVPTGTVIVCPEAEQIEQQILLLCDDDTDPPTQFLRRFEIAFDGTVTVVDTELDGTTPYVVAGAVVQCCCEAGAGGGAFNTVLLEAAPQNFDNFALISGSTTGWQTTYFDAAVQDAARTGIFASAAVAFAMSPDLSLVYALLGTTAGSQSLAIADFATATQNSSTIITGIATNYVIRSFATHPYTGELWAAARNSNDVYFYTIDPATAVATFKGRTVFAVTDNTFAITFMPYDGSLILAWYNGTVFVYSSINVVNHHQVSPVTDVFEGYTLFTLPNASIAGIVNVAASPRNTLITDFPSGYVEITLAGVRIRTATGISLTQGAMDVIPPYRQNLYAGMRILRTFEIDSTGVVLNTFDTLEDGTALTLPADFVLQAVANESLPTDKPAVANWLPGELAFGSVSTSYATLITFPSQRQEGRVLTVKNNLNVGIYLSFDLSVNDTPFFVDVGERVTIDLGTNGLKVNTNLRVKSVSAPGSGTVYATILTRESY